MLYYVTIGASLPTFENTLGKHGKVLGIVMELNKEELCM